MSARAAPLCSFQLEGRPFSLAGPGHAVDFVLAAYPAEAWLREGGLLSLALAVCTQCLAPEFILAMEGGRAAGGCCEALRSR